MQTNSENRHAEAPRLLVFALVTLVALYLVWAAFADITHGEPDLTLEYTFLCVCAVWFAYVSVSLVRAKRRVLGSMSLVALAAGLWSRSEIGPGFRAELRPSYLVLVGAILWFFLLSGILVVLSWRAGRK